MLNHQDEEEEEEEEEKEEEEHLYSAYPVIDLGT